MKMQVSMKTVAISGLLLGFHHNCTLRFLDAADLSTDVDAKIAATILNVQLCLLRQALAKIQTSQFFQ
jgi:hypothetical protein